MRLLPLSKFGGGSAGKNGEGSSGLKERADIVQLILKCMNENNEILISRLKEKGLLHLKELIMICG